MDNSQELLGHILENRYGERYFPSIVGEIFSTTGSDTFYQRHYGDTLSNKNCMYIIMGTDGGLLVNWLLTRNPPSDTRYVFVDLAICLKRFYAEGLIPAELPSNIHVVAYDEWLDRASDLSMKDYFYISKVSSLSSLAVFDGYHEAYVELGNKIEEDLGAFNIQMLQEVGSQIFARTGLENIAENRIPVSVLDGVFRGKTAILMAGGPSLDESFDWIRANRDNLVVLAVSRVAPQLRRENITPDFIFAIDPHGIIFHQSKEMLNFHEATIMVNMYHLNPQLVGQWRGDSLYLGARFPWNTDNNLTFMFYQGITVSHQALGAAVEMGFANIVLTGFDLCFSKEGFTHARGSEETRAGPYAKRSKLWVETNGGWQAETSADFYSSIPDLSLLAAQEWVDDDKKCRVVNPSAASARIEHIEHLPWDAIEIEPLERSAVDMSREIMAQADIPSRSDHYRMVESEFNAFRAELTKIKKLSEEALNCNARLFGRKGRPPDFKYKKRMDEIEKIIDEEHTDAANLVKKWSVADYLKLSRPDKDKEWSDAEVEETGRRYYQISIDSSRDVIKVLDDARLRLRNRMEEEKPRPNMKTLIAQWQKDGQPGRVLRFLDQTGKSIDDFPEKHAAAINSLVDDFNALMAETEHDYKDHCRNILASPMAILVKARNFYNNDQLDRLENFRVGLRDSNLENRDEFVLLMDGYLAQKAGNYEAALEFYDKIEYDLLEPERLKQSLSAYLGNSDLKGALSVARQLANRSPLFMPYYADLLRMTGDGEEAIAIYKYYLSIVTQDLITEHKLGKLYVEMGKIAEAREQFNSILKQDPENKAAQYFLSQQTQ